MIPSHTVDVDIRKEPAPTRHPPTPAMLFSTAGRDAVDSLPRAARLRYYAASLVVVVLAAGRLVHVHVHMPLAILAVLAAFVFGPLRAEHEYYAEGARRGCKPVPTYPQHDVLGLRYLVQTAQALKQHVMLQRRRDVLDALGHTFVHGVFPEWTACITTDEPENVKAVLSTRFDDWALPGIRIKSFSPVLGKRESDCLFLLFLFFYFLHPLEKRGSFMIET